MTAEPPTPAPARLRSHRTAALLLSGAVLAGLLAAPAASAAPTEPATAGSRYGTPLSPRLQVLADQPSGTPEQRSDRVGLAPDGPGSLSQDDGGRLVVDLRADSPAAVSAAATAAGATVVAAEPSGVLATLTVPATRLEALAASPGVQSVHEVARPTVERFERADALSAPVPATPEAFAGCPTGAKTSLGAARMNVGNARNTTGATGAGVKVGIISDSYNATKAKADIARADLPGAGNPCGHTTPVQVVADDFGSLGTDEGRAMAQIVHDVAPSAALLFADAGRSSIEMASHIRALRDAGAKVIVDDISWGDEAMYQDAIIAAAVDEVAADGVAYYSSAGNAELKVGGRSVGSYEAQALRPMTCPAVIGTADNRCHDFNPASGTSSGNAIGIPANGSLGIALGWNEPMNGIDTDLDLFVLDDATGKVLASSPTDSVGYGQAIEWASIDNPSAATKKVRIVVARFGAQASTTPRFKLLFRAYSLASVQWSTSTGGDVVGPTLRGHAAAAGGNAIGASESGPYTALEPFSSRGPASICWEPARGVTPAAPISPCSQSLVDYVAPDGVATSVAPFDPFYGTSAAAPHAAALAALVLDLAPCLSLDELSSVLDGRARPISGVSTAAQGRGRLTADSLYDVSACSSSTEAPAAPKIVSVSPTSVRLSMAPPNNAVGGPIAYRIQAITPTGTELTTEEFPEQGFGGTVEHDIAVEIGKVYRFRVQAKVPGWTPWSASSALAVPPFASASAYINQLATDFSGQAPTDWERQVITFVLGDDYGAGHAVVEASQFERWAPQIEPVIRLFSAYFLRKPDPSGLNYWLNKRRAGTKLDSISSTFAASNEFKTRYGTLSNRAFVELVYRNVLGRSGDAGGINYWTNQLDLKRKSRGQVMTGFSESSENLRRRYGDDWTINLFYGMVRRIPTNGELALWSPQIVADLQVEGSPGVEALAQHLFTSQEYLDRVS